MQSQLQIADKLFSSRLFLGTGKFGSPTLMHDAVLSSETQ
ncbi:MAG TPA: thiazole synthase, partial [Chitinophagales bacterium]|nr:thiazole synthase [Chitinophagales bacterium]